LKLADGSFKRIIYGDCFQDCSDARGQRADDRGQGAEDRGQGTE